MKKTTLYLLTNLTFLFLLCIIILTPRLNAKSATDDYALHVVDAETGENVAYQIDDGYEKIISEAYSPSNSIQNIEKTDGILPRNIVGPTDDRQLVTNTSAFPYTAIGRITVTHTDGTLSYGSGAMISPTLFATAGHVLINDNLSHPQSIKIEFGLYDTYSYYTTYNYSTYIYYGGYAGYDPSCDYAFVQLSSDVGTYTGHFGFTTLCYTDTVIYAAGYPGRAPYLYNCAGVVNSYTDTLMYISADFTAGQSGGPIYFIASDGMPYLMGVISGNSYDINIGRRIDYGLYQWLSQNGYL